MKRSLFLAIAIMIYAISAMAQVAMNTDSSKPDSSAILDIRSTNLGLLIPRITLTDINSAAPITNPAEGLLIFNISENIDKGLYYWSGSKWQLIGETDPCSVLGNPDIEAKGNNMATTVEICPGATLNLSSNTNGSWDNSTPPYSWTGPNNYTSTEADPSTPVTTNFDVAIHGGDYIVTITNGFTDSCSFSSTVTVVEFSGTLATPGTITGNTSICEYVTGESYSIDAVTDATSYNWTVPSGATVASGQGTTSITVDFGTSSGNISVRAQNECDTSAYNDLAVAVTNIPATPGTITGNTSICEYVTGESYSIDAVTDATSYNWTVPSDATVASGQGTTSITVNFGTSSGNVSVHAENSCGNSDYNDLAIIILSPPSITSQPQDLELSGTNGGEFSITATDATSYQWQENQGSGFADVTDGGVYSGATNDTLSISNGNGMDGYTYKCIVTNSCGSTTSDTATLNWEATPSVVSAGQTWMDRNLGASQVATASNDYLAYGSLFQWGRAAEGHEIINWTSSAGSDGQEQNNETTTNATTPAPDLGNPWDGKFIKETSTPYDWLVPSNNDLWQDISGTNNPCPSGFRLPTQNELNVERVSWSTNDRSGAFGSPLKLVCAGNRKYNTGGLFMPGSYGYLYSSTTDPSNRSFGLYYSSKASSTYLSYRGYALSVRCIMD